MATLGLDTSVYEQGIEEAKASTKQMVASLGKEYSDLQKQVNQTAIKYNEQVKATGAASTESRKLLTQLQAERTRLAEVQQALNNANTYMRSFGTSTKETTDSQQTFMDKLTGCIAKANILATVTTTIGNKIKDFAVNFVQSGIEYNAQIEKYTTGLTNMLGSAEAAQQAMENIQQDAARTPFNVDSLVSANQYLISAGENATYARKTIMALGDAVSATGGGSDELNRMAQNLQQIDNTGKASAVDIKQFAMAGINVYGILSDYTGKTTAEVQNMTISYDLLTQALQAASEEGGRYYNSMDTQSQTMNGRVSTLQDNVKQLAGLLTGDLSSGIGVVISNLNNMVVAAQDAYKTDGWLGLAGAITGLSGPIDTVKQKFNELGNAAITALDKASYWLNHDVLKKNAYSGYDTYEDYKNDQLKQTNRDRLRQNALAGIGISNKSWSERQAELAAANGDGTHSSITTSPTDTTKKKKKTPPKKTVTEKVISSQTDAATSYSQNAFGRVTTATSELTEKVLKSDGTSYDRFTKTVTESGKEMVNGVVKNYKTITKTITGENGKVTSTTEKVYEDASKNLLSTLTDTATKLVDGISTVTETITQKYADGSEQLVTTTTETGRRLVNGVWETYTRIKKISEDGQETTTENTEKEVSQYDTLLSAYNKAQKDVDTLRAAYEASAAANGENSEETRRLSALLKESEDTLTDAADAWKEYEKTTDRSYVVTKRFGDYLKKYNSAFADFGSSISALGEFFDSDAIQGVGEFFTEITDGVDKVINLAASTQTLVETLQQLSTTLQGIKAAGGVSTLISGAGKLLGGTGTAAATGAGGAGASGLAALGISVPEIGMILLAVLGIGAVGYGIYKLVTKNRNKDAAASSAMSYKDLQDAYWYGNERAFAGYDYRTDPYTFNPNNSAVLGYQNKMQEQLAKLTEVVQQYLPDVANQQIVLDDGTLVGKMAPGMDAQLGQLQALAERGN